MRSHWLVSIMALVSVFVQAGCPGASSRQRAQGIADLKGPYLGMKPPGETPEIFAPGIVSDIYWEHSGAVFSPDGAELFWSVAINEGRSPRVIVILHMRQEDGVWIGPELAPFNRAPYNHINSISPDGKRLYFFSSSKEEHLRSWVVHKTERGWGEPEPCRVNTVDFPGTVINEVHETRNGDLYFAGPLGTVPEGRGIVRSRLVDGKYQKFESLGQHVNSAHSDVFPNHSPTVDPDGRFVIFASSRPGGYGDYDLYISYRRNDDTWGPAINLGPAVNKIGTSSSWPQLSPDGKFLFYVASSKPLDGFAPSEYTYEELVKIQQSVDNGWGNIYWVSTGFIDRLRPPESE